MHDYNIRGAETFNDAKVILGSTCRTTLIRDRFIKRVDDTGTERGNKQCKKTTWAPCHEPTLSFMNMTRKGRNEALALERLVKLHDPRLHDFCVHNDLTYQYLEFASFDSTLLLQGVSVLSRALVCCGWCVFSLAERLCVVVFVKFVFNDF